MGVMSHSHQPAGNPAHPTIRLLSIHDSAELQIRLLGEFRVYVDSTPESMTMRRSRKASTLVKLLALAPNHRLHRDQVLETLWPDLGSKAAANNLR